MVEKVRELPAGHGLDASNGEYVVMIAMGIIDPAKVTRSALQNAASIAGIFLTTEVVAADKPEKAAAPMGGGDGAWAAWTSRPRLRTLERADPRIGEPLLRRPVA